MNLSLATFDNAKDFDSADELGLGQLSYGSFVRFDSEVCNKKKGSGFRLNSNLKSEI